MSSKKYKDRNSEKLYFEEFPSKKKRMYSTFIMIYYYIYVIEYIANRTKLILTRCQYGQTAYIFAQLTIGRIFFRLASGFVHLLSFIFLHSCTLLVPGAKCRTR